MGKVINIPPTKKGINKLLVHWNSWFSVYNCITLQTSKP